MRKFREMIFSGGNKGFTLIELLVVIAVLGILAGIAIPRMTGITDEAKKAAAISDLENVQTGLEMYYASNEEYPTTLSSISNYIKLDDFDETEFNITLNTTGYSISHKTYTTKASISN
jgi:prepilin-type N-terminal cleavage/methylation domain-containing protein